jgi:hypothetical protein
VSKAPKSRIAGADPVLEWEGNTVGAEKAWRRGPAGVVRAGHVTEGSPGTWEAPSSPSCDTGMGAGRPKPWPDVGSARRRWERKKEHGMVPLGEETSPPGRTAGSRSDR